ncbi:hypothetical protein J4573_19770 [Actinomadura barringtoniae]|uniref:Uncharacterized protein n=1 Tax=Actinomadura barringtoniae TaxID=1427535 RepID=A0A939T5C5_9ACTN|nr:hypothetical protein [Actinomadura barringtoniae]MBO2449349.1 hypothetical protein [Actinomadura barringtoniae]
MNETGVRTIAPSHRSLNLTSRHLRNLERTRTRVDQACLRLEKIRRGAGRALIGLAEAHERTAAAMERRAARRPEAADRYWESATYHRLQAALIRTLALPNPWDESVI